MNRNYNGFAPWRRGLLEHFQQELLDHEEGILFTILLGLVDFKKPGIVEDINTKELLFHLPSFKTKENISKILDRLIRKEYVKKTGYKLGDKTYTLVINKFSLDSKNEIFEITPTVIELNSNSSETQNELSVPGVSVGESVVYSNIKEDIPTQTEPSMNSSPTNDELSDLQTIDSNGLKVSNKKEVISNNLSLTNSKNFSKKGGSVLFELLGSPTRFKSAVDRWNKEFWIFVYDRCKVKHLDALSKYSPTELEKIKTEAAEICDVMRWAMNHKEAKFSWAGAIAGWSNPLPTFLRNYEKMLTQYSQDRDSNRIVKNLEVKESTIDPGIQDELNFFISIGERS